MVNVSGTSGSSAMISFTSTGILTERPSATVAVLANDRGWVSLIITEILALSLPLALTPASANDNTMLSWLVPTPSCT